MKSIRATLALSVLTGAGVLSGAALSLPAADLAPTAPHQGIEHVRLVCDVFGRCVRRGPPVVRVLPGIGFGRPVYRGPGYVGPEIGVRGGFGVDRRGDFGGDRRRRMEGGDRGDNGDRGGQGQRRRPEENGRGRGQMQGDRDGGMSGGGQGNGQRRQGGRRPQEGDQGGRGGQGGEQ